MRRRRIEGDGHRLPLMRRERWPEDIPRRPASSFRVVLSRLRRSHTASALSITFLAERLPGTFSLRQGVVTVSGGDRFGAILLRVLFDEGREVSAGAPSWDVGTLMLVAVRSGPLTVISSLPDSLVPPPVQTAPWALQSVVAG